MATNRDFNITGIFADNGVPPVPVPVQGTTYRDDTLTEATIKDGWPYDEIVPSDVFNRILFLQTKLAQQVDKQGIVSWSDKTVYDQIPAVVMGSNGIVYRSTETTGPGTPNGVHDPVTAANNFWIEFGEAALSTLYRRNDPDTVPDLYVLDNLWADIPTYELSVGMEVTFWVQAGMANTGGLAHIRIKFPNGFVSSDIPIKDAGGSDLAANTITTQQPVTFKYIEDGGARFVLVSKSDKDIAQLGNTSTAVGFDGGPVNYTATSFAKGKVNALLDGMLIIGRPNQFNTGTTITLDLDGLGAKPVYRGGGASTPIQISDFESSNFVILRYTVSGGGQWLLVNHSSTRSIQEAVSSFTYLRTSPFSEQVNYTATSFFTDHPVTTLQNGMAVQTYLPQNTGTATLNINGLGAKQILKLDGTGGTAPLSGGEIQGDIITQFYFDANLNSFILVSFNPAAVKQTASESINYRQDGTANDNFVVNTITGPALTNYSDGQTIKFFVSGFSTGAAATLNVDGLGAIPLARAGSTVLKEGDIIPGETAQCSIVFGGSPAQFRATLESWGTQRLFRHGSNNSYEVTSYSSTAGVNTTYGLSHTSGQNPDNFYDGLTVNFIANSTQIIPNSEDLPTGHGIIRLQIAGLPAKEVVQRQGVRLQPGDITGQQQTIAIYSAGTDQFVLQPTAIASKKNDYDIASNFSNSSGGTVGNPSNILYIIKPAGFGIGSPNFSPFDQPTRHIPSGIRLTFSPFTQNADGPVTLRFAFDDSKPVGTYPNIIPDAIIKTIEGFDLKAGDLQQLNLAEVQYDGSHWILLNRNRSIEKAETSFATTVNDLGTGTPGSIYNLQSTQNPKFNFYHEGMLIHARFESANTGNVQVNIDGLGNREVRNTFEQQLPAGAIPVVGHNMVLRFYASTNHFRVVQGLKANPSNYGVLSFDNIWPVGSIWFTNNNINIPPNQGFSGITWQKLIDQDSDLGGRIPVIAGTSNYSATAGQKAGSINGAEDHTLTISQIPSHSHTGGAVSIGGAAAGPGIDRVTPASTGETGGGMPHSHTLDPLRVGWVYWIRIA